MQFHVAILLAFPLASAYATDGTFDDPNDPAVLLGAAPLGSTNTFKLSATLQDSMVLQRGPGSATVWGFAAAGTTVTTTFKGKKIMSTAEPCVFHGMAQPNCSVWRAKLAPQPATMTGQTIRFSASTGETASLNDVLFGDVYVCGGQSNMAFSIGANENKSYYVNEANKYPTIRLFTVGTKTSSRVPLMDLHTISQDWSIASSASITDGSEFGRFSAVCWFFGKNVHDKLNGTVPIGLVSDNWGGTPVEDWTTPESTAVCGHASSGNLYNAMIVPYSVGPMAVSGFTWYQGESDLGGDPNAPWPNKNYSCTQTAMISQWREDFQVPDAFYAIVQLSTWYPNPQLLAQLRDQQLYSGTVLKNFAYGTNADYGAGGNIHPPYKQHVGQRLANAAMAIVYGEDLNWRSPTYNKATAAAGVVTVELVDVLTAGLTLKPAANAKTSGDCATLNAKTPGTCAGAAIQFDGKAWVEATVALTADNMGMTLTAPVPAGATAVTATSYGWGDIPMLTVYRADMEGEDGQLPVLPWNRTLA